MKLRFTAWEVVFGLLVLLMIASVAGLVPLTYWDVFWLVVTVTCIWAIKRIFFTEKKK